MGAGRLWIMSGILSDLSSLSYYCQFVAQGMAQYTNEDPSGVDNIRNGVTLNSEMHGAMDAFFYVICPRVSLIITPDVSHTKPAPERTTGCSFHEQWFGATDGVSRTRGPPSA